MVTNWIEALPESNMLPPEWLKRLHFVLDTGYDVQAIQNIIHNIGAKFTVGLRSERSIDGLGAREYFRRHRKLPWKTLRIKKEVGSGKKQERMFRVRAANKVELKRFGEVNVVCSEKRSRSARKMSRNYIATNSLTKALNKPF